MGKGSGVSGGVRESISDIRKSVAHLSDERFERLLNLAVQAKKPQVTLRVLYSHDRSMCWAVEVDAA